MNTTTEIIISLSALVLVAFAVGYFIMTVGDYDDDGGPYGGPAL